MVLAYPAGVLAWQAHLQERLATREGRSTGLVQKIGDCGEDYESWPEKAGLQAVKGPVPVMLPQSGMFVMDDPRSAPAPRAGLFCAARFDADQGAAWCSPNLGTMHRPDWLAIVWYVWTMFLAALLAYVILNTM